MEETFCGWGILEVTCGGRYGGKCVNFRRENMKKCYVLVWTVLEKYYFDCQGREVGESKLVRRWRRDGGNLT